MGQVDVDKVLTELKRFVATASNEEEFKINAERILYFMERSGDKGELWRVHSGGMMYL